MQFSLLSVASLALLSQPVLGTWSLDFYKSGCPAPGENGDIVGATAGQSDQELWCISTGSAHNVVADNILGDNMKVDLFSDAGCQYRIAGFETDGCHVIPSDTVIEAVRILPK